MIIMSEMSCYDLEGGTGVTKGGSALRAAPAPQAAGGAVPGSTQGSRYVQEGMGTFMRVVSDGFAQPFPALTDFPVNVGTGNVGMVPVGV